MFNLFANQIDPARILSLQNLQYSEKLLLSDTVPAQSQQMGQINVSSLGDFFCLYITGHFTTLKDVIEVAVTDSGVCYLRGKLIDASNQRNLFNDYIPLDLFLTPGRVISGLATAPSPMPDSNNLFYPQPFQYMFTVNSQIMFDVKNDSNYANSYEIVFHGVRFPVAPRERKAKK